MSKLMFTNTYKKNNKNIDHYFANAKIMKVVIVWLLNYTINYLEYIYTDI